MMRIAGKSVEDIRRLYRAARDAGITYLDHAEMHGFNHPGGCGLHECERRFSVALNLTSSEREGIILQTKTGIVTYPVSYHSSYDHTVSSAEKSLQASLGTDYIDVLLIHPPDALVEPEEVARAFDDLEQVGKIRAFGVSSHTTRQIDLL